MVKKSFKSIVNNIGVVNGETSKLHIFAVIFAVFICSVSLVEGIKCAMGNYRINQVYEAREKMAEEFNTKKLSNKRVEINQDKDIPGLVLLNIGDKDASDFNAKDIHNIFVVLFEKNSTYGTINIVALQKELLVNRSKRNDLVKLKECYDKKNPNKLYNAIESLLDYKVDSYIAYDNETIKELMEYCIVLDGHIVNYNQFGINDIIAINDLMPSITKKYGIRNYKKVNDVGVQPLDQAQMLTWVNLYYNDWTCVESDWKHLFFLQKFIEYMKSGSIGEFEDVRKILMRGTNCLSIKEMIKMGAAIGVYKFGRISRWPAIDKTISYNGVKYRIIDNYYSCVKKLHKKLHREKEYIPSKKVRESTENMKKIRKYINDFAEKKAAEEKAKEQKNDSATDQQSNNNNNDSSIYNSKNTKKNNNKNKSNNNNSKIKGSEKKVEPAPAPTPEPESEPEPTVDPDPQPQTEENNASDSVEQ